MAYIVYYPNKSEM